MGPDPEKLLEHRAFVRALARQLLFDDDRAEDVVQETWLAALRAAPSDRAGLRPWLATVARNFARRALRADRRRANRERRAARPEGAESAADTVGRLQWHRRLVDEVMALDEPYRSAIVSRFFDDLTPGAIAAQEGVPAATVRVRIHRALEQLRRRLDRAAGGSRHGWARAIVPLALPREAASFVAAATGAAGGIMMTAKTKVVAAALVAALLGTGVLVARTANSADEAGSGERAARVRQVSVRQKAPTDSTPVVPRDGAEAARSPVASTEAAERGGAEPETEPDGDATKPVEVGTADATLSGVITLAGHSSPVDSVHLVGGVGAYRPPGLWDQDHHIVAVDRTGAFQFDDVASGHYWLGVAVRDGQVHEIPVEIEGDLQVKLELGTGRVEGHVYDSGGRPVAGALVCASRGGTPPWAVWVRTAADGSYSIADLAECLHWMSATRKGNPWTPGNTETLQTTPKEGETTRFDFGAPRSLPEWRGVVRTRDGTRIRKQCSLQLNPLRGDTSGYSSFTTDAEGRFAIRTPAGRYAVYLKGADEASRAHTLGHPLGFMDLREGISEMDAVIPDAVVSGTVTLDGALMERDVRRHLFVVLRFRDTAQWVLRNVKPGRAGAFEIPHLPPGTYVIECRMSGGPVAVEPTRRELVVGPADREVRADFDLRQRR